MYAQVMRVTRESVKVLQIPRLVHVANVLEGDCVSEIWLREMW